MGGKIAVEKHLKKESKTPIRFIRSLYSTHLLLRFYMKNNFAAK
jgi:hypothetical protein